MDFGPFREKYFSTIFGNFGTRNSDIFGPPAGGGRGAGGGALRVGCGRSARRDFSTIFWARRRKAVRQGFDPELFMTELSCHQLGAKLKLFILTFRPESTYQHQKIKFSCRCGERVRLKMTLPAVFSGFFFQKKGVQHLRNIANRNIGNNRK